MGCHPTRCTEFEKFGNGTTDYLDELKKVIRSGPTKIVAIGECGLDYDRLQFCPKNVQQK